MIKVLVWCEHHQDQRDADVKSVYPEFMHNAIADFLRKDTEFSVKTATLEDPDCGITDNVLEDTDVILWWGHIRHHDVPDEIAQKVARFVRNGGGLIPLHSAHFSKPFKLLMGTGCDLHATGMSTERVYCTLPGHAIAKGVPEYFELKDEEVYTEFFDIPQPDELVFIGGFSGCEVFRAGCAYYRGRGKVFYFQPGHETFPIYKTPIIQQIICNAVKWAAPTK